MAPHTAAARHFWVLALSTHCGTRSPTLFSTVCLTRTLTLSPDHHARTLTPRCCCFACLLLPHVVVVPLLFVVVGVQFFRLFLFFFFCYCCFFAFIFGPRDSLWRRRRRQRQQFLSFFLLYDVTVLVLVTVSRVPLSFCFGDRLSTFLRLCVLLLTLNANSSQFINTHSHTNSFLFVDKFCWRRFLFLCFFFFCVCCCCCCFARPCARLAAKGKQKQTQHTHTLTESTL